MRTKYQIPHRIALFQWRVKMLHFLTGFRKGFKGCFFGVWFGCCYLGGILRKRVQRLGKGDVKESAEKWHPRTGLSPWFGTVRTLTLLTVAGWHILG